LAIKNAKNKKLISLNAEIRTKEREEAKENQKKREEKRDQLNAEITNSNQEELISKDIHLDEAAAIATDFIIIGASTAQKNQQVNIYNNSKINQTYN
jgi:hypothetical protein